MQSNKSKRLTLTIDPDLLEWMDHKVRERIFLNRSDTIKYLVRKMRKEYETKNNHYIG